MSRWEEHGRHLTEGVRIGIEQGRRDDTPAAAAARAMVEAVRMGNVEPPPMRDCDACGDPFDDHRNGPCEAKPTPVHIFGDSCWCRAYVDPDS